MLTPSQVAKNLDISVTTLRKYSLIVEKVTENVSYFARSGNKRIYTQKNISDFKEMISLNKKNKINLEIAAGKVFGSEVTDNSPKKFSDKEARQKISALEKELKKVKEENSKLRKKLAKNSNKENNVDKDKKYKEMLAKAKKAREAKQSKNDEEIDIVHQNTPTKKLRTLASMQLDEPNKKRKWWERLL